MPGAYCAARCGLTTQESVKGRAVRPDYAIESRKPVIIKDASRPFRVRVLAVVAGLLHTGEIIFNIVARVKADAAVAAIAV